MALQTITIQLVKMRQQRCQLRNLCRIGAIAGQGGAVEILAEAKPVVRVPVGELWRYASGGSLLPGPVLGFAVNRALLLALVQA